MLVAGLAVSDRSQVIAEEPAAWGAALRDGVLVMRNGHALTGKIAWLDNRYQVILPEGRLYVGPEKVDFCCNSLDEAYRRKRAAIREGSVEDHLELARWSQQHGLLDLAAQELVDAMAINPAHPMIPLLQRRLKTSVEMPTKTAPPGRLLAAQPAVERLDHLSRRMPPKVVEHFTRTIQPLLLNHCSTAGCHGPQSRTKFNLLRRHSRLALTRRVTQRNLQAALEWIDRDDPLASPLLTKPIRSHGSVGPIFADDRLAQYEQLVEWVERVTLIQQSSAAALEQQNPPAVQANPPAVQPASVVLPAASEGKEPGTTGLGPPDSGNSENGVSSNAPAAVSRGSSPHDAQPTDRPSTAEPRRLPSLFVPADPFDPEIFNRRFFPGTPRTGASGSAVAK